MDSNKFVVSSSSNKNTAKLTVPVHPSLSVHAGSQFSSDYLQKYGYKGRTTFKLPLEKTHYKSQDYMSLDELDKMIGGKEMGGESGAVMAITKEGLQHPRAVLFLLLWYMFSAGTIFLNKYILSSLNFNPYLLCGLQMFVTMLCGAFQMKYPLGCYTPGPVLPRPSNFAPRMIILGLLQLGTIFFGLVALYYVAVSFAETVKSSAPLVTVIIAWLIRGERTSVLVLLTLLPVMVGLAVCSSGELSFSLLGFLCALTTNVCEVIQSVFSKTVLSDPSYIYSPAELQFYPNACGVAVQAVGWLFLVSASSLAMLTDPHLLLVMLLDGICFHCQTITAYVLMSYISPVTYSVANTTKRAFLIMLSIMVFGNAITVSSGVGTIMVIAGVLLYSKAKAHEQRQRILFSMPVSQVNHHYK
ncbi:Sugar phosphate transporter domain [Trinorchestia longiramus]|nr:Sugar phosphate transporter domain [Trinorchestia longiramus]